VSLGTPPSRQELREHLVRTLIAGEVATPRQNNLLHYRRMAAGNPHYLFGLNLKRPWSFDEILAMMAERCGVDPDPAHFYGDDTIDPDLTLDALEAMAARLAEAAENRASVLIATGHPTGLLPVHLAVGRALHARGCRVLTPANGWSYEVETFATSTGWRCWRAAVRSITPTTRPQWGRCSPISQPNLAIGRIWP
jgi:hypothetical protein